MDLAAELWGPSPSSLRRIIALIRHVPLEGAFGKKHEALEAQAWQQEHELLALVAELIDVGNRFFFMANAEKGTRPPPPLKLKRPWEKEPEKRAATSEELAAIFGRPRSKQPPTGEQEKAQD